MQDKTINNALLALHRQGEGLEHVQALLALRGVQIPRKQAIRQFPRRQLTQVILGELQRGPKTCPQIADVVQVMRPDLTRRRAVHRVYMGLCRLRDQGRVVRHENTWEIRPKALVRNDLGAIVRRRKTCTI